MRGLYFYRASYIAEIGRCPPLCASPFTCMAQWAAESLHSLCEKTISTVTDLVSWRRSLYLATGFLMAFQLFHGTLMSYAYMALTIRGHSHHTLGCIFIFFLSWACLLGLILMAVDVTLTLTNKARAGSVPDRMRELYSAQDHFKVLKKVSCSMGLASIL